MRGRTHPSPIPETLQRYPHPVEFSEAPERASVAMVVPHDFEMEWEYVRALPQGIRVHFARTPYLDLPMGIQLARRLGDPEVVAEALRFVAHLKTDATLFACASGSFVGGVAGERRLLARMVEAGARRPVTASGALLEALEAAAVRRVAVALPYTEPLGRRQEEFLREAGYDVVRTVCLGLESRIDEVTSETLRSLAREAVLRGPRPDALFIGCTALRTFGLIPTLEEDVGCPVFTSNQVSLWAILSRSGCGENPAPDHSESGRLLYG